MSSTELHPCLSARRGSLSAPDPFARNKNVDHSSAQMSRLTIIRITSPEDFSTSQDDHATKSPAHSNSIFSVGNPCAGSEDGEDHNRRMSFARSSFSAGGKSQSGGVYTSDSPLSRSRSTSAPTESSFSEKRRSHYNSPSTRVSQAAWPPLLPQQICDLAHASLKLATCDPTFEIDPSDSSSAVSYPNRDHAMPDSTVPGFSAPFSEISESHYLPFIDRPSEVTALLTREANIRLMELLKQTFPSHLRDVSSNSDDLDPTEWSFARLVSYMTECPRSKSIDRAWVENVRRCVHTRSEAIWERFKDVLGVPPELDVHKTMEGGMECVWDSSKSGDFEAEAAWVEPIYPMSSPLSPRISSVSPLDMGDAGFRHGGRGHGMETIGEKEEEDFSTSMTTSGMTDALASSTESEHIHALCLHTYVSLSDEFAATLDSGASPPSTSRDRKSRSFSEGHADCGVPPICGDLHSLLFGRGPGPTGPREIERSESPLFPSNFRRLSNAPTLAANNPALCHKNHSSPVPSASSTQSGPLGTV